ncbi:MAG: 2Fe-2S iron-sulfur cluster binding domain-containing protein, partial [Acetobacteraceae bacterium]|nr:2Fe-2S iron-sulfur cluster binding domain-containing protein [Acetobacteraceae bacterium]
MALSIALNFEDGVTRFIEAKAGDTIADASYRLGINIPLDCRDGACGTCKCRVQSGQYEPGDYIEDALTEEEAAEGLALACQARPKTDMVVDIFASSEVCKTKGQIYQAQIKSVDRLSPTAISFTLEGAGALSFLPGQYVNVLVPGTDQRRSYSFSSPPGSDTQSFMVRDIGPGVMSTYLRDKAEPGSAIEFIGPSGSFYLREVKRPLLFLAGGTGLAPFLSMLGKLAQTGCSHPAHLVYGVTNDSDLVGTDQLDVYAKQVPGFTYSTVVA